MFSHSAHIMTLANSIIGVGILAMPFCFQKCGIILSVLLLVVSNSITRICCHYLIKSSLLTRRKSFEWLGFHAFGSSGKLLVELCIIGFLLGTCITYYVVVGDLGPQILMKMLSLQADEQNNMYRTLFMLGVTLCCILPLGMLKNVDSLSSVCTASIGFYVCLAIKIVLESENHVLANDWQEHVVYWRPAGILQCLPIFSMALSCQMQIFEVFGSINNQCLDKLNSIVKNAVWICTFVYIAVGFFGYVAFCNENFSGNILMNFSASFGSDVIKMGFILSLAFSFPLVIFPCRASIYSLIYRKEQVDVSTYIPESRFRTITIFIVIFSLLVALMIPSVELIIGLVGSTIGVAVCMIYPALCFRKIVKKESTERQLAQFIIVCGFCLMILGTYANLNAIDEKGSGAHLEAQLKHVEENNIAPIIADMEQKNLVSAINENKLEPVLSVKKVMEIPTIKAVVQPIKERHRNSAIKKIKSEGTLQVISPAPEVKIVELPTPKIKLTPIVKPDILHNKTLIEETINKDAIKKEEDMTAEEQKNVPESKLSNIANEQLKNTQNELKETKKLLDELKVELVKQNKETQELVVEKLDEVVEKVEKMERKVQMQKVEDTNKKTVENYVQKNKSHIIAVPEPQTSLLTMLAEAANNAEAEEAEAHKGPYEPKSYKAGVLLENQLKNSKAEKPRLPLPLARMLNNTDMLPKALKAAASVNNTILSDVLNITLEKDKLFAGLNELLKNVTLQADKAPAISAGAKDNVEAIRREILEINESHTVPTGIRVKRDNENNNDNCLPEPKIDTPYSALNDLELVGHSRALMSIEDKDQEEEKPIKIDI